MGTSLLLDFDPKLLATEVFMRQAHEYFAALPQPDPQYGVTKVAELLDVKPETVRSYFDLNRGNPRRLPYVDTTGSARGYRVRLSDLTAWQERNRPGEAPLEVPVRRPARRQTD